MNGVVLSGVSGFHFARLNSSDHFPKFVGFFFCTFVFGVDPQDGAHAMEGAFVFMLLNVSGADVVLCGDHFFSEALFLWVFVVCADVMFVGAFVFAFFEVEVADEFVFRESLYFMLL